MADLMQNTDLVSCELCDTPPMPRSAIVAHFQEHHPRHLAEIMRDLLDRSSAKKNYRRSWPCMYQPIIQTCPCANFDQLTVDNETGEVCPWSRPTLGTS